MKEFKVGDLVKHVQTHIMQGFYLVIEVKIDSPNKAVRIKSVVDGFEYWEVSSYLEVA